MEKRQILKSTISKNNPNIFEKFIWHTQEGCCEVCAKLDGREYEKISDIPDRPHPNCKCYIEAIPFAEFSTTPQDRQIFDVQNMVEQIYESFGNIESMRDELYIRNSVRE